MDFLRNLTMNQMLILVIVVIVLLIGGIVAVSVGQREDTPDYSATPTLPINLGNIQTLEVTPPTAIP